MQKIHQAFVDILQQDVVFSFHGNQRIHERVTDSDFSKIKLLLNNFVRQNHEFDEGQEFVIFDQKYAMSLVFIFEKNQLHLKTYIRGKTVWKDTSKTIIHVNIDKEKTFQEIDMIKKSRNKIIF